MTSIPKLDPREKHFFVPWSQGLRLFLRYLGPPVATPAPRAVLYIHGATFPSALSIAHRFDGFSWRDHLVAAGFGVWGLDFLGYGGSDRYPEMDESPDEFQALGRAQAACRQIERAVQLILHQHAEAKLSLIAHSWGSMPAAMFASANPHLLERLVLFAPIAGRPAKKEARKLPAWRLITLQQQWDRFVEDVPEHHPPVLLRRHFDEWGERYLDTDVQSRSRQPFSVKVPNGPVQDIEDAESGLFPYDPSQVRVPVAIIRGEWDHLVTDDDARWLFDRFTNSPLKRDIKLSRATHLAHLESGRFALYREALAFLEGGDQPETNSHQEMNKGVEPMTQRTIVQGEIKIPGYDYGQPAAAHSPLSMEELRQLEQAVGWSEEDAAILQRYPEVFRDRAEAMVDAWRSVIGAQEHLVKWFFGPDGKKDEHYAAKIKKRFVQWVTDACFRPHDRAWLDYQEEIGLRHTPEKKNRTDGAHTPPVVPLRYLIGFITVVTISARKFFVEQGIGGEELQRLEEAWARTVQLHVTLWSRPYTKDGLW